MSQDITQDILSQAVEDVITKFCKVNLAELERRLPLSRQQLRRLLAKVTGCLSRSYWRMSSVMVWEFFPVLFALLM